MIPADKQRTLISELKTIIEDSSCLSDPADKILYGYDNSGLEATADIVTLPSTTKQVAEIVCLANKHQVPIICRGSATNTCGATVPINGGIILSTQKLNKLVEINPADRYAIVQPGLINADLQQALAQHNLFWPPDPSSSKICTIGGNIACNSGGPSAVKYGVTRDHVLGLTLVTGSGAIVKTGVYTTKGVVGYDLTRLVIGSEGTLGIITEAVVKLSVKPQITHTLCANFESIDAAAQTIAQIMQQDITPSALEIMDENCLSLIKTDKSLNIPPNSKALLLIEVNGNELEVNAESQQLQTLISQHPGNLSIDRASTNTERQRLWQARKALSPKLRYIAPKKINEDVVVPISNLPKLINYINELATRHNISIVNFGHAGNGNIHVNLLIDPNDLDQKKNAEQCLNLIFSKVLELRGTISGEHGVGLTKAEFAKLELSDTSLDLTRKIKRVFDPDNILNPQLLD